MGCKYWKRDSVLGEYHCTAPAEESEQEDLEQRINELLSVNGSLQFKNDQLSAKCQRLDVAEKMAREARERMVAAEQCAAQAERDAVRECEKISKPRDKHVAMMIRKRYPQHFEGSDDTKQRGPIRPVIFHRRGLHGSRGESF